MLGNALSNISLVFRKISSDYRQIEFPQDAGIWFALQQETKTFCDELIARNVRPAQSNPIIFLQRDLMSRGGPVGDSDFVLIAGEMTHFDHAITKNPIKNGFCQCEEISQSERAEFRVARCSSARRGERLYLGSAFDTNAATTKTRQFQTSFDFTLRRRHNRWGSLR